MQGPGDSELDAWAAVDVQIVPTQGSIRRHFRYFRANELFVPAMLMGVFTVIQAFRVSWHFVVVTWLVVILAAYPLSKLSLWTAGRKLSRRAVLQFRAMEYHVKDFDFPSRKEPAWSYDCLAVPVPGGLEVAARGQIGIRGTLHGVLSYPEWTVAVEVDPQGRFHSITLTRNGETILETPALGRIPESLVKGL